MWTWTDAETENDVKSKEDYKEDCKADDEVFFKEDEEDWLSMWRT